MRLEALDEAVIVTIADVKGRIIFANNKFCAISGYSREEALGQDHRIVNSGAHSKSFFRSMYRLIARGGTWRGTICNKAKDGSYYWVDTTIIPQLDGSGKPKSYMGIRIDVTPQKLTEFALKESERHLLDKSTQLEATLENISQGIMMIDASGIVSVINSRAIELLGLPKEIMNEPIAFEEIRRLLPQARNFRAEQVRVNADVPPFCEEVLHLEPVCERQLPDGTILKIQTVALPDGGTVQTYTDVTERRKHEERVLHVALHDALTGLANRPALLGRLEHAWAEAKGGGPHFAILMLDLDGFKSINDSLGHPAGDALLKAVARRLESAIGEGDFVARLGGDEFAIIQSARKAARLPGAVRKGARDDAVVLASRILDAFTEPFAFNGHTAFVGTSIGASLAPADANDPADLLKKADLALYEAKAAGRGGYRFFDSTMKRAADERHQLEADLRLALTRGEFELHYQPIVDARTRKVRVVEALLRWHHPEHGLMMPDRFISVAEDTGQIVPVGEWILHRACQDAMSWPDDIKVAVNLSAVQFRKGNLLDVILCSLVDSGLSPDRLEVEVTESVLLDGETEYATLLHQLRNVGVSVALDDFGTGYASLSYLRQFPFDKIKIDRSFVGEISGHAASAAIVCSIVSLGRALDIVTTAEGVETEEQLDLVRSAGVCLAQGYLFGRPRPLAELIVSEEAFGAIGRKAVDTNTAA